MHSSCLIPFVILAVGLTGCATYEFRDIDPQQTRIRLESRSLNEPGLQNYLKEHGHPVSDAWDLEKLTLAAFYYNPVLDAARADYAAAAAVVTSATALPNPAFNFSPGYNLDAEAGVSPWILGYFLDIPLDLTGRRKQRTLQARQQEEIARLNLATAAWGVRREVRQALIELQAAEEFAAFWEKHMTLFSEIVKLVENEAQVGEISFYEAGQTQILVHRAEIDARESERVRAQATIRLAEALGVSATYVQQLTISFRTTSAPLNDLSQADARAWAAQNRPDVLAALSAYAVAQTVLKSEVARQYPDLSVGPGYELDQGEGKWSLSLGLTLPIFNRNEGPIAVAEAQREASVAHFLALQNHVLSEVDRAFAEYASVKQDLDTFRGLHTRLDQQTKILQILQAVGEVSRLELARAQLEIADTQKAELVVSRREKEALAALEDAIQRPL